MTWNKVVNQELMDISELPMAKFIVADPEAGNSLKDHELWINKVLPYLEIDGILVSTGHQNQTLYKSNAKNVRFLIYIKKTEDLIKLDGDITYITDDNPKEPFFIEQAKLTKTQNEWCDSIIYFMKKYTKEGDIVIDLFSGRGTTSYIAKALGRNSVAIERDEKKAKYITMQLENEINEGDIYRIIRGGAI